VSNELWAVAGGDGPVDVRVFVHGVTAFRYGLSATPKMLISDVPIANIVVQNLGSIPIEIGNDQGLVYGQGVRIAPNATYSSGAVTPGPVGTGGGGTVVTGLPWVDVKASYGAACDGKKTFDGAMTAATPTLTSSTAAFVAGDVGKSIAVLGAKSVAALATPTGLAAASAGGGVLPAGTYYYRVSAYNRMGETLAAAEVAAVLGGTNGVSVTWNAVAGAAGYYIYGRATGAEKLIGVKVGSGTSFFDGGWADNANRAPQAVPGADATANDWLITTITGFIDATHVTLGLVADVTVAAAEVRFGTLDTAAINNAIAAQSSIFGATLFIPGWSLISGAGVAGSAKDNITYECVDPRQAGFMVFPGPGTTGNYTVDLGTARNTTFRRVGFDGGVHKSMTVGIASHGGSPGKKGLRIDDCIFSNYRLWTNSAAGLPTCGVWVWNSDDVTITDSRAENCRCGFDISDPTGPVTMSDIYCWSDVPYSFENGILLQNAHAALNDGGQWGLVNITNLIVDGINLDSSTNGANTGFAMSLVNVLGASLTNIQSYNCYPNTGGGGPLFSGKSYGTKIFGLTSRNCRAGLYIETNPEGDSSIGTAGVERGVVAIAPEISQCGMGIAVSYAAGTSILAGMVHDNVGGGIIMAGERGSIIGGAYFNNYTGRVTPTAGPPGMSGIQIYAGNGARVIGVACYDNQTVKTQDIGIAVDNGGHTITGCDLTGNAVAAIVTSGTTNRISNNIGWLTEAKGTGTITAAVTVATITHGLAVTPTAAEIAVTATNNPTNDPGDFWIDTITATQFNVNCRAVPGASTLTFAWMARTLQ
jgi:hypothetical protein